MIEEKRVEDSRVETVHIIRPNHLNAAGRLFGGMLMQWLDEVAGMVAKRHTRANVITVPSPLFVMKLRKSSSN